MVVLTAALWMAPLQVSAGGVAGDPGASATRVDLVAAHDAAGDALGTLVMTSLVAPVAAPARPLLVVFNGGPGAGSAWLQLGLFGPERAVLTGRDAPRLEPAADGMGDRADLLFVDPLGTGFSRARPGIDPQRIREWQADGDYLARAIADWIARHGRRDAPLVLVGESYGTERAIAVAEALARQHAPVRLAGMVLISQTVLTETGLRQGDPRLADAVSLPSIAATACHYGLAAQAAGGPLGCADAAWHLALHEYQAGSPQSAGWLRMARLAGLAGAAGTDLSRERYRRVALADQAQVLGRYDSRLHAAADRRDPSLAPMIPAMTRLAAAAARREQGLGASPIDGTPYVLFDPAIMNGWHYGPQAPAPGTLAMADRLGRVLAANRAPALVAGGVFDLVGSYGADRELARRLPQIERASYPGGHMFYLEPPNRADFLVRLRAFVARVGNGPGGQRA